MELKAAEVVLLRLLQRTGLYQRHAITENWRRNTIEYRNS